MKGVLLAALVLVLAAGGYLGALQLDGNVHTVEPGQLYRSAQLGRAGFERVVRAYGIRTIVNLRGAHPGAAWYDGEIAAARSLGVAHYDFALSAEKRVGEKQIDDILRLLRTAKKPILVHCQGGADRSGLVSALYEKAIAGKTGAVADRQLSLRYGHFPYLTSKTGAMDQSFWAFVGHHPR